MKNKYIVRIFTLSLVLILSLSLFSGCDPEKNKSYIPTEKIEGSDLFVK